MCGVPRTATCRYLRTVGVQKHPRVGSDRSSDARTGCTFMPLPGDTSTVTRYIATREAQLITR